MTSLGFDLEIRKEMRQGIDWVYQRPLGIITAGLMDVNQVGSLFYSSCGDLHGVMSWQLFEVEREKIVVDHQFSRLAAMQLVDFLEDCLFIGNGIISTWNGASFDFLTLAEESGEWERCRQLALNHYDMGFQFFMLKGFMKGLDNVCQATINISKINSVHGELVPALWKGGQTDKVMEYQENDCLITARLFDRIERSKFVKFMSSAGLVNHVRIEKMLTVAEAMQLPDPDNSWMKDAWDKTKFTGWITSEITNCETERQADSIDAPHTIVRVPDEKLAEYGRMRSFEKRIPIYWSVI